MQSEPVHHRTGRCQISGLDFPMRKLIHAGSVSATLLKIITRKYPSWDPEGYISIDELTKIREEFLQEVLEKEKSDLRNLETEVQEKMKEAETKALEIDSEMQGDMGFGQRLADKIATFGGSWTFIISFLTMLCIWMGINFYFLQNRGWDPYPFILLNLILSCIAALQAPVIMMSQNRQEEKDRRRAKYDYQVNLKAELEIRQLHEKIDHLLLQQSEKLFEIQQVQVDLMELILNEVKQQHR